MDFNPTGPRIKERNSRSALCVFEVGRVEPTGTVGEEPNKVTFESSQVGGVWGPW